MKQYLLITVLFSLALSAHAASLNLVTPNLTVSQGIPFTVSVVLDPQGQNINATDGSLSFPADELELQNVYETDSVISLWMIGPRQTASGTIAWSGIAPGGFGGILGANETDLTPGRIFSAVFKPLQTGTVRIGFAHAAVLLGDGQGTPAVLSTHALNITIGQPDRAAASSANIVAADKNLPEPFNISLGRDPSIENGKWFAVWSTQDKGTGVAAYDIFESKTQMDNIPETDWRPATSPYVLNDQSLMSYVYVRAMDFAGNARVAVLAPENTAALWPNIICLSAIIIAIGGLALWLIRKKGR